MKRQIQKIVTYLKGHKIALVVSLILLVFIFVFVLPRARATMMGPKDKYETAKVKKEDILQTVSASGEIEAESQVTLKFQTSGLLTWVGVKEGDYVKKWQAIASLDKRELEKNIKKELNDYMNERWNFEQDRETYRITTDDLSKYTLTNEFRRILEKAQFDLDNTVLDVEIKDLAIKLATITTPIEGIVTQIDEPTPGVNITPATATFTIADSSKMKFVVNVDESDIGQVRIGQKVKLTLDAYPDEEFEGEVGKIAFAAITTKGGGTAFPVDILLPENEKEKFKIGMNGDAEMIIAQEKEVLTVPTETIKEKNGKRYVEVIEGRSIKEVEVETGIESENEIQIIKGLVEGQVVITEKKD